MLSSLQLDVLQSVMTVGGGGMKVKKLLFNVHGLIMLILLNAASVGRRRAWAWIGFEEQNMLRE